MKETTKKEKKRRINIRMIPKMRVGQNYEKNMKHYEAMNN